MNGSNGQLNRTSQNKSQPALNQQPPKTTVVPIQKLTYTSDNNLQPSNSQSELSVRTPPQQHLQQPQHQLPTHVTQQQSTGLLKTASLERSPVPVTRASPMSTLTYQQQPQPIPVSHHKSYSQSSRQSSERSSMDRRPQQQQLLQQVPPQQQSALQQLQPQSYQQPRQHPSETSTPSPVSIATTRRDSEVSEELRRLPHHTSGSDINGRGLPSPSILRRDQENASVDDDVLLMAEETVRELETKETPLTAVEQRRYTACKKIVDYARVIHQDPNSTANQSVAVTPTPAAVFMKPQQSSVSSIGRQMQSTHFDNYAVQTNDNYAVQTNGGQRVNGNCYASQQTPEPVVLSVDNYQREPSSGMFQPQQPSPQQFTAQYQREPSAAVYHPEPISPGSYTQTIPIDEPIAIPRKQPPPPPPKRGRATSQNAVAQSVADLPTTAPLASTELNGAGVYVYGENDARVQVLGGQEVYRGDPRQRRLNTIQQQQQQTSQNSVSFGNIPRYLLFLKIEVDGSNLPFREKMKLFAAQLGESTPKDKMKASSAQKRD